MHKNSKFNIVQDGQWTIAKGVKYQVIDGQRAPGGYATQGSKFIASGLSREEAIALADKLQAEHDAKATPVVAADKAEAYQHFGTFTDGAGRIIAQYDGMVSSALDGEGAYRASVKFVLEHGKNYNVVRAFPKPVNPAAGERQKLDQLHNLLREAVIAKAAYDRAMNELWSHAGGDADIDLTIRSAVFNLSEKLDDPREVTAEHAAQLQADIDEMKGE